MRKFWILLKKELREMITLQSVLSIVLCAGIFVLLGNFMGPVTEEAAKNAGEVAVIDLDDSELPPSSEERRGRSIAPPEKKYGVVAVAAGKGLADVFRDLGADGVISGGQTMNPSTEDIMREIDKTPAEIVYVLPNNKNIIMAAQQCVPLAEGKRVVVLPTKTVPQGISALMVLDPEGEEGDNTAAMSEALSAVATSEIT